MNTTDELVPLTTVITLFRNTYQREYDQFELMQHANICLRDKLGAVVSHKQVFIGQVKNGKLKLPPCVYWIEAVTRATHNIGGGYIPSYIFQLGNAKHDMISGVDYQEQQLDPVTFLFSVGNDYPLPTGPYLDYTFEDGELEFSNVSEGISVEVLYYKLRTDDEGIPMVTRKTAIACAAYINWIDINAGYYQGKYAKYLRDDANEEQWLLCRKARANGISKNHMDKIFDVLTSFNRKRHNIPFGNSLQ